jgi:hypothetical protein
MFKTILLSTSLVLSSTVLARSSCANDPCLDVDWSDCVRLSHGVACTIVKGVSYQVEAPTGSFIYEDCVEIYTDCYRCRSGNLVRDFKHTGGGGLTGSDS